MNLPTLVSSAAVLMSLLLTAFSAVAAPNTVQFAAASYSVAENTPAGSVTLTVTATRRGDPNETITAAFTTVQGSATSGQDFTPVNGTLTFGAGEVERTIVVPIINDNLLEDSETFTVTLSSPSPGTSVGSPATATVTILDDDSQSSAIRFESATYTVNENAQTVTVAVTRSGGLGLFASASYATTNGTASAGSDYVQTTGAVNFPPGSARQTFTVPIIDDAVQESSETFSIVLSAPSTNATLVSPTSTIVTILDDDGNSSTVQFSPITSTVSEASGQAVLTVSANRMGDPNSQITVDYASRDGSAIQPQDYGAVTGRLIFGPGETQKQIVVPIVNDLLLENLETFFVDLSSPVNATFPSGGASTATVNIADDDSGSSTIQFSSAATSVGESDSAAILQVVRSGGIGLTVSVNYATANGTATAGSDYVATAGTLTFAPGETSKTISIPVLDDSFVESNETFNVTLSNPTAGAVLASPSTNVVTIVDNDGGTSTVQFNPTTYSTTETPGNSSVTLAITATRLGDPTVPITVNYATSNGTATAGFDYVAATGTITFGANETQKLIAITILDDSLVENPENFFVTLTSATNASISGPSATVTIADDDSPTASIGFSASSSSVDEGAGTVTLTVIRSGGLTFPATVRYQTSDGSARAGLNYVASGGSLSFAPGETSMTIQIPIIDEGTPDPTLQFTVTLTDPNGTGFVGGQSTTTVNILDNDANVFRFEAGQYAVNEGAGSVALTVIAIRSGDASQQITVDYVTTDGTATEGSKYLRSAGRLTFAANVTSQTITVPIVDNNSIEGTTAFNVILSNPRPTTSSDGNAPSRLGSPSTATVSIIDNDARTFQFSVPSYTYNNSVGQANLFVTFARAGDTTGTYSVGFTTLDGSAVAGRDYTPVSSTLVFGPNETSKSISVSLISQPPGQPIRQFFVRLSNPSPGAELGQPLATVSITNPDLSTKVLNISTRGPVEQGDGVMIAGFIMLGESPKQIVLRGLGPSLTQLGVASAVSDPSLALIDANGTQLGFNDDYRTNSSATRELLAARGLTPLDTREAALVTSLAPGNYTAVLRGKANGIGLVEVYDIENTVSTRFANISTRAKVEQNDNGALIAGFIIGAPNGQPGTAQRVILRALGPSLQSAGVTGSLSDTTLDLYRGSQLILSNDNWKSNSTADRDELASRGVAPSNDKESALVTNLDPGSYSAVIRGKNNTTGVALVEVYQVSP